MKHPVRMKPRKAKLFTRKKARLDNGQAESQASARNEMSTAELKQMIDARTAEERKWIAAYLLDQMFAVPELRQTAEELAELERRRGDLRAGRQRVSQTQAEAHWKVAEEPEE